MAQKIKKGDQVIVLAGRDKGKKGEVIRVMPKEDRALVRGVNLVQRHQRQTPSQEGGIVSKEASIHLSNLAHADPRTASRRASVSSCSPTARRCAWRSARVNRSQGMTDHGRRR